MTMSVKQADKGRVNIFEKQAAINQKHTVFRKTKKRRAQTQKKSSNYKKKKNKEKESTGKQDLIWQ